MRGRDVEELELVPPEVGPLLDRMRTLAGAGRGWVNLQPGVPEEEAPPPPRGLAVLLGSDAPPVPVCTWVPGRRTGRRPVPDQVGIQHGSGPGALRQLAAADVPLQPGWRWRQDNPRRGLVVELPAGTDPAVVLQWLFAATEVLTTVPLTGRWRALVHTPQQHVPR